MVISPGLNFDLCPSLTRTRVCAWHVTRPDQVIEKSRNDGCGFLRPEKSFSIMRKNGGFCSRATGRTPPADIGEGAGSVIGAGVNVPELRAGGESFGASI